MFRPIRLVLLCLLIFGAAAYGYYISDFECEIEMHQDGSYLVSEQITVDFGTELRHGIYRDIPYKYDVKGFKKTVRIRNINVFDKNGNRYQTKITRRGGYLKIRIGSSDKVVSGKKIYIISYEVTRGMLYYDDHDELYWNVTGTEWGCSIWNASAKVYYPEGMPRDELRTTCFAGPYGTEISDCSAEIGDNNVVFTSNRQLGAMEGLTIGLWMPKGFIKKPGFAKKLGWFLGDNWQFFLFPVGLLLLIVIYLKRGRDPLKLTIMPRYEPPEDFSPAQAGTVLDESVDMRDMTSMIVDLAVRGYLKIVQFDKEKILFFKPKDYGLVKLRDADSNLQEHEKIFFTSLFAKGSFDSEDLPKIYKNCPECEDKVLITVSSLKDEFYTELPKIKNSIYDSLVDKGMFPSRPDKVRQKYGGYGVTLMVIAGILSIMSSNISFAISLVPLGILTIIFGRFMPRKSREGSATAARVAGFEEFVRRVEKDRIERMAKEDPTVFERLLPYAMALGVADQWAEAFADIFKEAPGWYVSSHPGRMPTYMFVNDLGSAVDTVGAAMASRPRSSGASGGGSSFGGGGFSGGGFGGGGGGAW